MKRFAFVGALALLAAPVQAATLSDLFTKFIVVGDSLSDNGNTATLLAPPPLPIVPAQGFDQQTGVASNGFTWAKEFTDEFGANGFNLSFAAARARTTGDLVPDLTEQVFNAGPVTLTVRDIGGNPVTVTRPLYPDGGGGALSRLGDPADRVLATFFVGGNDFRDAFATTDPVAQATILNDTFLSIQSNMAAMQLAGVNDFVLMNIPDFSALPGLNQLDATDPRRLAVVNAIATFNDNLFGTDTAPGLTDFLRSQGARVTEVDIFALLTDQEKLGFFGDAFNTTESCVAAAVIENLANCDNYLFWDDIHPTEKGHQLIAMATREALAEIYPQLVPLPAPALMLLTALAGFAALRRVKASTPPA